MRISAAVYHTSGWKTRDATGTALSLGAPGAKAAEHDGRPAKEPNLGHENMKKCPPKNQELLRVSQEQKLRFKDESHSRDRQKQTHPHTQRGKPMRSFRQRSLHR